MFTARNLTSSGVRTVTAHNAVTAVATITAFTAIAALGAATTAAHAADVGAPPPPARCQRHLSWRTGAGPLSLAGELRRPGRA